MAIIECAWGGQRIEGFISEDALLEFPEGAEDVAVKRASFDEFEAFEAELEAFNANPVGPEPVAPGPNPAFEPNLAGQIFNGMVAPMVGYGVRGIVFYQGEANSFFFASPNYAERLEALALSLIHI